MISYLYQLFNKIYTLFEVKKFEHKSVQTNNTIKRVNNCASQTDNYKIFEDKSIQTDVYDENDWSNLIWVNA